MKQVTNIKEIETDIKQYNKRIASKNNVTITKIEKHRKRNLEKDIEEHLLKSEDDIRNGRVKDARKVFKEWKEKYGI